MFANNATPRGSPEFPHPGPKQPTGTIRYLYLANDRANILGRDLFVVVRMFGLSDLHAKAEAKALLNVLTGRPYFQPCQKPLLVIQCTLFRKCGENYRYVIHKF